MPDQVAVPLRRAGRGCGGNGCGSNRHRGFFGDQRVAVHHDGRIGDHTNELMRGECQRGSPALHRNLKQGRMIFSRGAIGGSDSCEELAEQRMFGWHHEHCRLTAGEQEPDLDFPGTGLLESQFHR